MRLLLVVCLLMAWGVPASAAPASMTIYASLPTPRVERVRVRPSGTSEPYRDVAFQQPPGSTQVTIPLEPGTPWPPRGYQISLEGWDWLYYWSAERAVADADERPTVRPEPRLNYATVGAAAGAAVVLAFVVGALALRRKHGALAAQQAQLDEERQATLRATMGELPADVPPLIGHVVTSDGGRSYALLRLLGHGAMGAVFEATSRDSGGGKVAIKVVKMEDEDVEGRARFRREMEICQRLQHPGLVKVIDNGTYDELPFIVMELVDGVDLRHVLDDHRRIDVARAVGWTRLILQAIGHAHAGGIIHRDLKPENVMITRGEGVKIMDFGVASKMDTLRLTSTGTVLGTPVYMSPEHLNAKEVTPASDVYSVGVILFEMLSGRTPFGVDATDVWQVLTRIVSDDAPPLRSVAPDVPASLADVVDRMVRRDPSGRYGTAQAAMEALAAAT